MEEGIDVVEGLDEGEELSTEDIRREMFEEMDTRDGRLITTFVSLLAASDAHWQPNFNSFRTLALHLKESLRQPVHPNLNKKKTTHPVGSDDQADPG